MGKLVFFIFALCCHAVYAQDASPTPAKQQEPVYLIYKKPNFNPPKPIERDTWVYIGTLAQPKKDIYYRDYRYRLGRGEAWVKWILIERPKLSGPINKSLKNITYYLQYATADCDGRRLTLESTIFYNAKNMIVPNRFGFAFSTFGEPILRDSVGELIWTALCTK